MTIGEVKTNSWILTYGPTNVGQPEKNFPSSAQLSRELTKGDG